jgi:uncharacterized protein
LTPFLNAFARRCVKFTATGLNALCCSARARGDAGPDSDYDIAVFLRDMGDRFVEMDRLADLATDILNDGGPFIHAMPYHAGSYEERTPLMHEIRRGGIDL